MDIIGVRDIAILGRPQNAVVLQQDRTIVITTDILKTSDDDDAHITLDALEEKIEILSQDILLAGSKGKGHAAEPIVYGDALVETLRWILAVLMTHKHPPNAPPIPDFFAGSEGAISRRKDMETYLLNQQVKSS